MDKYAEKLVAEGTVTAEEVKDVAAKYDNICEEEYNNAKKETHIKYKDWLDSPWSGFFEGKDPLKASIKGGRIKKGHNLNVFLNVMEIFYCF